LLLRSICFVDSLVVTLVACFELEAASTTAGDHITVSATQRPYVLAYSRSTIIIAARLWWRKAGHR